jgi:hypothetical protein
MRICFLSDTWGATWQLPWSRSALAEISINVPYPGYHQCVVIGAVRSVWRAAFLFHVDTCIFPWDKTGLTMGKPEVNLTFGSREFLAGRDCQFLQTRLRKEA